MAMKPFKGLLLLIVCVFGGLVLVAQPLLASTVQVGTCLPGVKSYSNITAAVGAVTAGSTIKVCPGKYPEQVNIFTPLTLEGVSSGNSDRAVLTVPCSTCLSSNIDSIFGDPVVAQVLADAGGTVNISNITVDGTGNNQNNLVDVVGIFYASGTSGTVNGVTTRFQSGNFRGYGIWVENGNSTLDSVTIENSDVHDVDNTGIFVGSNQNPPTLTDTIKGNMIESFNGLTDKAAGSVVNNIIAGTIAGSTGFGIDVGYVASNAVLSNTITNMDFGIVVRQSGATVRFNTIFNSFNDGIVFNSKATVESNTIMGAFTGIDFVCHTGNIVSGNTISDALFGIGLVPSGQIVTNTYHNVDTIRSGGC
jgi:hypothetical protein